MTQRCAANDNDTSNERSPLESPAPSAEHYGHCSRGGSCRGDWRSGRGEPQDRSATDLAVRLTHVGLEEPALVSKNNGLRTVSDVELVQHPGDVGLDGCVADEQLPADLGV